VVNLVVVRDGAVEVLRLWQAGRTARRAVAGDAVGGAAGARLHGRGRLRRRRARSHGGLCGNRAGVVPGNSGAAGEIAWRLRCGRPDRPQHSKGGRAMHRLSECRAANLDSAFGEPAAVDGNPDGHRAVVFTQQDRQLTGRTFGPVEVRCRVATDTLVWSISPRAARRFTWDWL
jgi:hypothetical protein